MAPRSRAGETDLVTFLLLQTLLPIVFGIQSFFCACKTFEFESFKNKEIRLLSCSYAIKYSSPLLVTWVGLLFLSVSNE